MSLFNEVLLKLGLPLDEAIGGEKITMVDFRGILVEGHRGVFSYTQNEILLNLKRGKLRIIGDELVFKCISPTEIYVSGEINGAVRE